LWGRSSEQLGPSSLRSGQVEPRWRCAAPRKAERGGRASSGEDVGAAGVEGEAEESEAGGVADEAAAAAADPRPAAAALERAEDVLDGRADADADEGADEGGLRLLGRRPSRATPPRGRAI
jgi:hypothetical protein